MTPGPETSGRESLLSARLAHYSLIHGRPGHESHPLSYSPRAYRAECRWVAGMRLDADASTVESRRETRTHSRAISARVRAS